MSKLTTDRRGTSRLTGLAILTSLVIVLTVFCTFIKFGPFSITLALAPIIIGGAVLGTVPGTMLGFLFSAVVLITGLFGWDGGTIMYLMGLRPGATIIICILKGTLAGLASGAIYHSVKRFNSTAATVCAAIVCPLVNTGVFVVGMLLCFYDVLAGWAGGQNMVLFILTGIAGINFVIELVVNLLLSTGITRITEAVARKNV